MFSSLRHDPDQDVPVTIIACSLVGRTTVGDWGYR